MSQHTIVHLEFSAKDPAEAGKFYADLFDWKVDIMEEMNYVTYQINEEMGGGFLDVSQEGFKVGDVIPYVSTPDIEATLTRVEELGGKTLQPPGPDQRAHAFVGHGRQQRLADPRGMNRPAAAGTEEGTHRLMGFDLRDKHHLALVLDAQVRGLAGTLHQVVHDGAPHGRQLAAPQE